MLSRVFVFCSLVAASIVFASDVRCALPHWEAARARNGLVCGDEFSFSEPSYNPTTGNGYFGWTMGSPYAYIANVFNGVSVISPSHGAKVPVPFNVTLSSDGIPWKIVQSSVDFEIGVLQRLMQHPSGSTQCVVSYMAHSVVRELFLINIECDDIANADVVLPSLVKSVDFHSFVDLTPDHRFGVCVSSERPYSAVNNASIVLLEPLAKVDTSLNVLFGIFGNVPLENQRDFVATLKSRISNIPHLLNAHYEYWERLNMRGIWFKMAANASEEELLLPMLVNSSLHWLRQNYRSDFPWAPTPGGLGSPSYKRHVFWDADLWINPTMQLIHPEFVDQALQYRLDHLEGYIKKAQGHSLPGAQVAWESAYTGDETCPVLAPTGERELHISSDTVFAIFKQYLITGNRSRLIEFTPLLVGIADMWVAKAECSDSLCSIKDVIPPDEYAVGVDNSAFTNAVTSLILDSVANLTGNLTYSNVAAGLRRAIPYDSYNDIILEFDGYTNQKVKQADVVLLQFPLQFPMNQSTRSNNLKFYETVTDWENGPCMTASVFLIDWLELGDFSNAVKYWERSYANALTPWFIWSEVPGERGAANFLTGIGGFLQAVVNGWLGLRVHSEKLTVNPVLPSGAESFTATISYHRWDLTFEVSSNQLFLSGTPHAPGTHCVIHSGGHHYALAKQFNNLVLSLGLTDLIIDLE